MKELNKLLTCYWISVAFLFVMAATVLFMPYAVGIGEQNRALVVAVGLTFWISALTGYCFIIAASFVMKKIIKKASGSASSLNGRPGIIAFFSNKYATIADITMIFSLVVFVIINLTELKSSYLACVFLFLLIFSIHMHCLFNGKIFKVIQASKTIKHKKER